MKIIPSLDRAIKAPSAREALEILIDLEFFNPSIDPKIITKAELFVGAGYGTTAGHDAQNSGELVKCFALGSRRGGFDHERRVVAAMRGAGLPTETIRAGVQMLIRIRQCLVDRRAALDAAAA